MLLLSQLLGSWRYSNWRYSINTTSKYSQMGLRTRNHDISIRDTYLKWQHVKHIIESNVLDNVWALCNLDDWAIHISVRSSPEVRNMHRLRSAFIYTILQFSQCNLSLCSHFYTSCDMSCGVRSRYCIVLGARTFCNSWKCGARPINSTRPSNLKFQNVPVTSADVCWFLKTLIMKCARTRGSSITHDSP